VIEAFAYAMERSTTPLAARIAREYGTPAAVIDMDRVERNIARIQAARPVASPSKQHSRRHSVAEEGVGRA
jgi:diaminopimelate decarboxylase